MITVSTEVKAIVEKHAKAVCAAIRQQKDEKGNLLNAGFKDEQFNQDLNAYAVARSLKEIGVKWDDKIAGKVLEVLKKGGNASALRQAITETAKKQDTIANTVSKALLGE